MNKDIVESHIKLLGKLFPVINCDPQKIKAQPETPDVVEQLHQLNIEQINNKDETETKDLINNDVKLMGDTAVDVEGQPNSSSQVPKQLCEDDNQLDQKQTDSFFIEPTPVADQSFIAEAEANLSGAASSFVPVSAEPEQEAECLPDQPEQNELVEEQLDQQEQLTSREQTDADTSNVPTEPTPQLVSAQNHGDAVSADQLLNAEAVQGHHQSISSELDIISYAKSEWRGNTYKAKLMCEGYHELSKQLECRALRRVRGDNYCALRSVAYHILERASTLNLFRSANSSPSDHVRGVVGRLVDELNCSELLHQWNFANRIPCQASDRLAMAQRCADSLAEQLSRFSDGGEKSTVNFFNSADSNEVYLFEAMKLLMLECAVRSHNKYKREEEVPTYVWLLFARDSSENPTKLLLNHLNAAGDSGGLEQIEMFLLGHALEVTIRVARPLNIHQEDFITFYPDHAADSWDQIDLIAEDDRHYNIAIR